MRGVVVLLACVASLTACDSRSAVITCSWDAPKLVGRGIGPSIVMSGASAVLAFDNPSAGLISVLFDPGGPAEVRETIPRDPNVWPSDARLHRANGALQLVGCVHQYVGLQRLERTHDGWNEEARGVRLRQGGSTSTADRLLVHGYEMGSPQTALAINTWEGGSWSLSEIPDLCFFMADPMSPWDRIEYAVGVDGATAQVATACTRGHYRDLMLWAPQAAGWVGRVVQQDVTRSCPGSYPVLPRQGCCDRLAYVSDLSSTDMHFRRTIRVATRSGESWTTTDVGPAFVKQEPRPTAMAVVAGTTHLAVLRDNSVVVYSDAGDGWQEQRFEAGAKPVSADLVVDEQGAVHLVYGIEGANGDLNSIYYAHQTCQLAH